MRNVISKISAFALALSTAVFPTAAIGEEHVEPIKYGDFSSWLKRNITESVIIGGQQKIVYAIAPEGTVCGNVAYNPDGESPWATNNVCVKVSGVTKASNAVYPSLRTRTDKCAKLCTQIETVKVLGIINMDVMVTGSIFLGKMVEPVSSTALPYSNMEMGIPYTGRPKALRFDYKVDIPDVHTRVKASGVGGKKILQGHDEAVVFVLLQRRWEDADGSLHAMRVGTGGETFGQSTQWCDGHNIAIHYGDCSGNSECQWLGLKTDEDSVYYARNSKGELVPVVEEGWDRPDATPTHVIVMMSSANSEPYVGTEGLTFYVDNVQFVF